MTIPWKPGGHLQPDNSEFCLHNKGKNNRILRKKIKQGKTWSLGSNLMKLQQNSIINTFKNKTKKEKSAPEAQRTTNKVKDYDKHHWTEQAEKVNPFLDSDQHPPLFIAHLAGTKAVKKEVNILGITLFHKLIRRNTCFFFLVIKRRFTMTRCITIAFILNTTHYRALTNSSPKCVLTKGTN